MNKRIKQITTAVNTVFYQFGFDRIKRVHGLSRWNKNDGNCKGVTVIERVEPYINYYLVTTCIDDHWYLVLCCYKYNEYDDSYEDRELLVIPVDVDELCFDTLANCVDLIEHCIAINEKEV